MEQQKSDEDLERERWQRLLAWMQYKGFDSASITISVEPRTREGAGRGLFATRTLQPSEEPFLSFPAVVLMNARTLKPIYPSIALEGFSNFSSSFVLNATQLLSIHLALHRPIGESSSSDPHFGPFIDTVPRSFDSHPLSWLVKDKLGTAELYEAKLLQNIPPSAFKELQQVATRFWDDWDVATKAKLKYLEELKSKNAALFDLKDFLWGWLVVNTRCLYADLFRDNLPMSNLTLCPIIDLANHTTSSLLPTVSLWERHSDLSRDKEVSEHSFLPPSQTVEEGEEIFLKYGWHSKKMLFAEYGFVDECANDVVEVSDLIDSMIMKKDAGRLIKKLLPEVAPRFASDLNMYTDHPSWNLHCILRLINIAFPTNRDNPLESSEVQDLLQVWRKVTLGEVDRVSDANELLVRHDLESVCEALIVRSSEYVGLLKSEEVSAHECEWYGWAKWCIIKLWEGEELVGRKVKELLASGEVL